MGLLNINKKLLESKFPKVKSYRIKESETEVTPFEGDPVVITENEAGDLLVDTGDDIVQMSESEVEKGLGALNETQKSVSKKELANICSINNTKGRLVKESEVDDATLKNFNKKLGEFAKKHKDFDIFDDDYTGKDTDDFIDMLSSVVNDTKMDLFENVNEGINQIETSQDLEALTESIKIHKVGSKRFGGYFSAKLKEAIGNPLKVGSVAYKLKHNLRLKEAISQNDEAYKRLIQKAGLSGMEKGQLDSFFVDYNCGRITLDELKDKVKELTDLDFEI